MQKNAVLLAIAALCMLVASAAAENKTLSSDPIMDAGRDTVSFIKGQKELFILLLETGDDYKLIRKRYSDYKLA